MAVTIKSQREIDLMRESGHILYKVHEELGQAMSLECLHWILTDWVKS